MSGACLQTVLPGCQGSEHGEARQVDALQRAAAQVSSPGAAMYRIIIVRMKGMGIIPVVIIFIVSIAIVIITIFFKG